MVHFASYFLCYMKKRRSRLAAVTTAMSLGMVAIAPSIFPVISPTISSASATTFKFQENPNLVPQPGPANVIPEGNRLTILNADTVKNVGSETTPESIYIFPFLFAEVGDSFVGLEWENSLDAYTNSDYDGLGNRLILNLTNFTERVRLGDLADVTGVAPLPLMIPCDNSPSCPDGPPPLPLPPLSQDSDDEVPFVNLGVFAPDESKSFDVVFDFTYADNRTGPLRLFPTFSILSTTSVRSTPVSEPATGIALLLAGGILLHLKSRP